MSQSLSKIFIHLVWHIKNDSVPIRKEDQTSLYAYMGGIIKNLQSIPIVINGMYDHIHILFVMSKNISIAQCVKTIKQSSSLWIKTRSIYYHNFAWQGGYAAFSVSHSLYEKTKHYIENQEAHHKVKSFQNEYRKFLEYYNVDYDERYVFTD